MFFYFFQGCSCYRIQHSRYSSDILMPLLQLLNSFTIIPGLYGRSWGSLQPEYQAAKAQNTTTYPYPYISYFINTIQQKFIMPTNETLHFLFSSFSNFFSYITCIKLKSPPCWLCQLKSSSWKLIFTIF